MTPRTRWKRIAWRVGWWICDHWRGNGAWCPGCRIVTLAYEKEDR